MNPPAEVAFTYKPKLSTFSAIVSTIVVFSIALGIGAYGLFGDIGGLMKIVFLLFSVLMAYLSVKLLLVTIRSASGGRYILIAADRITSPVSPESRESITLEFSKIKLVKAVDNGNASFLEIAHKAGSLRIPSVMVGGGRSFERLVNLLQDRVAQKQQELGNVGKTSSPARQNRQETEKTASAPLSPATEALMCAIDKERSSNPLVGAKIGGKEVFQRLMDSMKDERGVHVDSLLCALGALAGYSCQAYLRAAALANGMSETVDLVTVGGANGKNYFFGDALNQALAESKYSIWSLAAGAAQHNGCSQLPDINEIFEHTVSTVGTDSFGVPRFPEGHNAGDLPVNYLKAFWHLFLPEAKLLCKEPHEWPVLFGIAIQEAIDAGMQALSPDIALKIVMEAAIPMSKVDLENA